MVIQVERLWLFQTIVSDPFIFEEIDGVDIIMENERVIKNLDVNTAIFFIDNIAKSGLNYTKKYGGEDTDVFNSFGKTTTTYEITFNLPVLSQATIERMIGREFSVFGMRRDLSYFAIFGKFVAENVKIDNEVQQRVSLVCENTQAKIYDVKQFNFDIVENIISIENPSGEDGGFDYDFDFGFN